MSSKPRLKLDWCDFKAAKYAVEKWHYSRSMPAGKTIKIGVWENDQFIGVVIFSHGSNQHIGKEFGLTMFQCCELTRVALNRHQTPVTRILKIAMKLLIMKSPGVELIVSYADCDQGHHGGIYAGGNWVYVGKVQINGGTPKFLVNGKLIHGRTIYSKYGPGAQKLDYLRKHIDPNAQKVYTKGKHKYVMPLKKKIKTRIEQLRKPYPKCVESSDSGTLTDQVRRGGAIPTSTLSSL